MCSTRAYPSTIYQSYHVHACMILSCHVCIAIPFPYDEAGEKPLLKSICLTPHSGPCPCGERDCALERHRVVGVPPLAHAAVWMLACSPLHL